MKRRTPSTFKRKPPKKFDPKTGKWFVPVGRPNHGVTFALAVAVDWVKARPQSWSVNQAVERMAKFFGLNEQTLADAWNGRNGAARRFQQRNEIVDRRHLRGLPLDEWTAELVRSTDWSFGSAPKEMAGWLWGRMGLNALSSAAG
jgi:hypothetical protein